MSLLGPRGSAVAFELSLCITRWVAEWAPQGSPQQQQQQQQRRPRWTGSDVSCTRGKRCQLTALHSHGAKEGEVGGGGAGKQLRPGLPLGGSAAGPCLGLLSCAGHWSADTHGTGGCADPLRWWGKLESCKLRPRVRDLQSLCMRGCPGCSPEFSRAASPHSTLVPSFSHLLGQAVHVACPTGRSTGRLSCASGSVF